MRRNNYHNLRRRPEPPPADVPRRPRRLVRSLALVLMAGALAAACWLLYQSPVLRVTEVKVVGAESLDAAMLARISGLAGKNIILADTKGAEAKLAGVSMVRSVSVERSWPGKMVIKVQERRPWGYWQVGDQIYVIDDEGYILDSAQPDEGAPVILHIDSQRRWLPGEQVDPAAVGLASELIESAPRSLGLPVVGLEYSDASGLTVVLEGGLRASFGDSNDLDYKISVLYVLLERVNDEGIEVRTVDLRFGDAVSFQ